MYIILILVRKVVWSISDRIFCGDSTKCNSHAHIGQKCLNSPSSAPQENGLCYLKSRRSILVESIRNHDKALGLFHRVWPGSLSTEVQTQNTQMVMDKGAGDKGWGGACSSIPARCLAPHRAVQSLISLCSVDKLGMFQCDFQALSFQACTTHKPGHAGVLFAWEVRVEEGQKVRMTGS